MLKMASLHLIPLLLQGNDDAFLIRLVFLSFLRSAIAWLISVLIAKQELDTTEDLERLQNGICELETIRSGMGSLEEMRKRVISLVKTFDAAASQCCSELIHPPYFLMLPDGKHSHRASS